jgi:hypothetical protein
MVADNAGQMMLASMLICLACMLGEWGANQEEIFNSENGNEGQMKMNK